MESNKNIFRLGCFLFLAATLNACSSKRSIQYDYSYLYNDNQKLIKPNFKVFHQSSDSSTLYFQLNSDNLLYGKIDTDSILSANILCKYMLYTDFDSKNIVDSATIPFFNYNINSANMELQSSILMAVPDGKRYPLEVRFRDEYRDLNVVYFLWVDKRNNGNPQYYLIKNKEKIIFNGIVNKADSLDLIKSPLISCTNYEMRYSSTNFTMSPPPFFLTEDIGKEFLSIDSMKSMPFVNNHIKLSNWSKTNEFSCTDDSLLYFYFHQFYEGFPKIMTFEQMVGPLRYITTTAEYKTLLEAEDKKAALDQFWLNIAGSKTKAKQLIKEYYNRVELANEKFTSFKEGWKTDRGIIYIIFGQPSEISKGIDVEQWIYGEENQILSIGFHFLREDTPFSNNDFELIRNKEYKNIWYLMVDNWRNGKI